MAGTADTTAGDPGKAPVPRATLDELVAEPERVASAADAAPVRIERPDGAPLVLMSFETLRAVVAGLRGEADRAASVSEVEIDEDLREIMAPVFAALVQRAGTLNRPPNPGRTRSIRADELTDQDLDQLRTAPLPSDSPEFADDEDLIWRG